MHGLPLTYNKDMQEDKEHLFDAVDTLELCLRGRHGMLGVDQRSGASGWPRRPRDELLAATDVADLLVARGLPFREAHGVVGGLVRTAVDSGTHAVGATAEELARASPLLDDEFYALLRGRRLARVQGLRGRDRLARVREQLAPRARR